MLHFWFMEKASPKKKSYALLEATEHCRIAPCTSPVPRTVHRTPPVVCTNSLHSLDGGNNNLQRLKMPGLLPRLLDSQGQPGSSQQKLTDWMFHRRKCWLHLRTSIRWDSNGVVELDLALFSATRRYQNRPHGSILALDDVDFRDSHGRWTTYAPKLKSPASNNGLST